MRRVLTTFLVAGSLVTGLTAASPAFAGSVRSQVKALAVTTSSLPDATSGKVYSAKLAAVGGVRPYTWSITEGSLPAGLTLVPTTGLINGRPSGSGMSSFTVAVTDSEDPAATATADLSITVDAPPLQITTTGLPAATVGIHYTAKLAATGGVKPYAWALSGATLPPGLKLNAATGVISGTPTAQASPAFEVTVTDAESPPQSSGVAGMTLTVYVAPLNITTAGTLPQATVGQPYSVQQDATGGVRPYTWSTVGTPLPPGLKLNAATGLLSGTPQQQGTYELTIEVTDAENPQQLSDMNEVLVVTPVLTVTTTSLPSGTVGDSYSAGLSADGGYAPYSWSIVSGSLPPGLFFLPDGTIQGTPMQPSDNSFTVQAVDSSNPAEVAQQTLTIEITPGY